MIELMVGEDSSKLTIIGMTLIVLTACFVARCVYDLFFHPLRKFPGPKLAAIWYFYEFYYDVIKDGTYLWEIEKMHRRYGPIVRINSGSLHIHDPEYYSTIYAGRGRRTNKEHTTAAAFPFPHSTITTVDHDLHRKRRAIISPYFSKRVIVGVEPIINERLGVLCSRLGETIAQRVTIDLNSAFSLLVAEVIEYHFYDSHPNYLSSKDLRHGLRDALVVLLGFYNIGRFLPISLITLKKLPLPILGFLNPSRSLVMSQRDENKEKILKFLNSNREIKSMHNSVIVNALIDPSVPAEEKTIDRLLDEGQTILFAGVDTTARTLGVAMFHLLNDKRHLQKLRQELDSLSKPANQAWTVAQLEVLPFMRGVVQEALRLSYGLVVRIPRIAPEEALQYKQYIIPPGTPVNQSVYFIHNDPSIFPNPHLFAPERWMKAAQEGVNLDKYMVSFSKGSRACLGINLAYALLYLGIAKVVSSLDMDLFETKQQDIEVYHTRGFGFPREGSGEVKVRVTDILKECL